jgi:hypothetical protein
VQLEAAGSLADAQPADADGRGGVVLADSAASAADGAHRDGGVRQDAPLLRSETAEPAVLDDWAPAAAPPLDGDGWGTDDGGAWDEPPARPEQQPRPGEADESRAAPAHDGGEIDIGAADAADSRASPLNTDALPPVAAAETERAASPDVAAQTAVAESTDAGLLAEAGADSADADGVVEAESHAQPARAADAPAAQPTDELSAQPALDQAALHEAGESGAGAEASSDAQPHADADGSADRALGGSGGERGADEVDAAAALRAQLARGASAPISWLAAGVREATAAGRALGAGARAGGEAPEEWDEQRKLLEGKLRALASESDRLRAELKRAVDAREAAAASAREKDAQIQQVLAEGEALSRRQAEQEKAIKRLRREKEEAERAADGAAALGARVASLQAENGALRRSADGSETAQTLLAEKDAQIQQVLAEGEALSRRQAELERALKQARAKQRDAEATAERLAADAAARAAAVAKVAELEREAAQLAHELLAKDRAIADALAASAAARADLESTRRQLGETRVRRAPRASAWLSLRLGQPLEQFPTNLVVPGVPRPAWHALPCLGLACVALR